MRSHAAAPPSPPPIALYDGPDRHHLQQFSRALKILLLPQAFVPRRRLALQIAAPTPIAAICSKRRRILPPTPHPPFPPSRHSTYILPCPSTLLTPQTPPPVNNWLMADEMVQIAAGGALTCYKGWTPDTGSPPLPTPTPNHRHDTLFKPERPGGKMQFLILSLLLQGGGGGGRRRWRS